MLIHTDYTVSSDLLQQALVDMPIIDFRYSLNTPTGDFFYDPWALKTELVGTIWEKLYDSLPVDDRGEARIIQLLGATCYAIHADIDDRYHLNISGNNCYLIDLDSQTMYPIIADGQWYSMDAGKRHTATNFGNRPRYQLVIRRLMKRNTLEIPIQASIKFDAQTDKGDARFRFDESISPWLNQANKQGFISEFKHSDKAVSFAIDEKYLQELQSILPMGAQLECDYT